MFSYTKFLLGRSLRSLYSPDIVCLYRSHRLTIELDDRIKKNFSAFLLCFYISREVDSAKFFFPFQPAQCGDQTYSFVSINDIPRRFFRATSDFVVLSRPRECDTISGCTIGKVLFLLCACSSGAWICVLCRC
jgi:hypothetical protein